MVINARLHFILHENGLLQNNPIYGIINILTLNSFVLEPANVCGRQMFVISHLELLFSKEGARVGMRAHTHTYCMHLVLLLKQ